VPNYLPGAGAVRLSSAQEDPLIGVGLGENSSGHHVVETGGFLEQRAVAGVLELNELFLRCLQLGEPFIGQDCAAACLISALYQVDRHLQGGDIDPEIDVLQLRLQHRVGVEERAHAVHLLHQ